ncbi:uncharacterized protein Nost isoform X3 [Panulirus ornatus]|uniref:uncharacterized protein Nost isoform X3 n=1 Tax=Panulirus ornatus TaxID=150431 RepID=UPI003A84DC4A
MDKLRNIKHRLSMSVDKLSPSRRSKSQQRKSVPLVPFSDGDIPGSVMGSKIDSRPTSAGELTISVASGSRPSSYCEPDADDSVSEEWLEAAAGVPLSDTACDIREPVVDLPPLPPSAEDKPVKRPTSSVEGGESLMSEVMKEVEKITEITDNMKNKRLKVENERPDEATVGVSEKKPLLDVSNDGEGQESYDHGLSTSDETLLAAGEVTQRRPKGKGAVDRKAVGSTSTTLSIASTCRAESLTSGYFSDSDVTLSDGRCDSGYLKSALAAVTSEGADQNKSVVVSVKSETNDCGTSAFSVVKSEGTVDAKSTVTSVASEDKIPVSSAFTSVTSQDESQGQPAFIPVTLEEKTINQSAFTCVTSETKTVSQSAFTSVTSEKHSASSSAFSVIPSEKKEPHVAAAPETETTATPAAQATPSAKETKVATVTKKESIYSRIMRKKDSSKEPIYAKIKPKLTIETSFQPIEPSTAKNTSNAGNAGVVKPEPIYSVVKPRDPGAPLVPSSPVSAPITPGSPTSPFAPVVSGAPNLSKKVEPIYSKIRPKDSKSSTLPREMSHSKVNKDSGTLSREPKYSKAKGKEPIYAMPLPLTPREEAAQKRESFYSQSSTSSDYGKVTVRVGEISPSRPAVITINNPGYAAPPALPSSTSPTSPSSPMTPSSPVSSSPPTWPSSGSAFAVSIPKPATKTVSMSPTAHVRLVDRLECTPKSKSPLESPEPHPLVASDSSLLENSDTESTGRAKLSRLVEELAQELEAVSRRIGSNADADDVSKKEVLARLLSTYDVPKNLRRVEEADEDAILEAEQALVPVSVSMDELRYVDDNDDNAETVYADVPDYSQDEFVIALDDENDPRYASLTRALRHQKAGGESPGKISRKTAAVYANALNVVNALRLLINSNSTKAATVINKMGTLARPYAQRMQGTITDTTWIQRVIYHKSGHNGFDELRRYIKSGGEFCKELAVIMNERAELEASYAKGLNKLSGKLLKASKESMGTVNHAWQMVGAELEQEGDMHKSIASAITDDVVRPLRQLIETQHKIRKGVESMVDKTTKNLHDWRAAESKAKKQCYSNCRENEKIQDMMLEARLGRGKTLSDKETMKMEKQRRKAEEAVQKSDLDYYTCCIRAERARLEWESAVYKGSSCFQTLEEERLQALKNLVVKYHKNAKEAAPKMVAIAARLDEPVATCDVEKDIQTVISAKGTGENIPEQMLPDFYAEDMNNIMNRERRREALEKFVQMLRTDLERERRGKQGVENLAKALQETPTFGGEESQQDVNDKLQHDAYNRLQHMKAMLAYLEAARYKVQSSLDELNNRPKMTHPLAKHIEVHRDKQGLTFSILKVPPWVRGNSVDVSPASDSPTGSPNWNDRGTADGTSVQPDSDFEHKSQMPSNTNTRHSACSLPVTQETTPQPPVRTKSSAASPVAEKELTSPSIDSASPKPFTTQRVFMSAPRYPSLMIIADEFSSQGSDRDYQTVVTEDNVDSGTKDGVYYANPLSSAPTGGRCKALYDYEANMYDELTIRTGDIINIHEKQPDGWWVGELDNIIGIFPATYVEEID